MKIILFVHVCNVADRLKISKLN